MDRLNVFDSLFLTFFFVSTLILSQFCVLQLAFLVFFFSILWQRTLGCSLLHKFSCDSLQEKTVLVKTYVGSS